MKEFYVIDSKPDGENIPYFFETIWHPALPAFDLPENTPAVEMFESNYRLAAKIDTLDVDILVDDFLASSNFLELCNSFAVDYLSVPVDVELDGGQKPSKGYNFFCVAARKEILDEEMSIFALMDDRLLRPKSERGDLPVYDRIDKFVIADGVEDDLFYCEEIKRTVCSAAFKAKFMAMKLTGLNFISIDENYVYAPWDGF